MTAIPCVFCDIAAGTSPATIVEDWELEDVIAIVPRNPVTDGHLLVIPRRHVSDAAEDHEVTASTMGCAAVLARRYVSANIITSIGAIATQTVFHLHLHVVPRRLNDGLALPWTPRAALVTASEGNPQ